MTKTIHLYESHFKAMLEEVIKGDQKVFIAAVLEPHTGETLPQSSPGSLVGGHNFHLSTATLCQVLSTKPYQEGFLVRLRGEGRVGLSHLDQV